ncbi:MAG: adenylate/guanylate cyclase domain-containing protein [Treponema sp.]|nr:adenylate/guanylate cyclase domain-containing protein [Candidatus Treponema scatequi]
MNYNIEFQIASIIFISTLMVVFFSKRRWSSPANYVFRFVMILTFATLALDIASVITITKFIAGNEKISGLNTFLSKTYLIVMTAYIVSIDIYVITNTLYSKISQRHLTWKYVEAIVFIIGFVIGTIVIINTPLLYGGTGKYIYSFGTPSNVVYTISSLSVVFVLCVMLTNLKKVSLKRFIPIIIFCCTQGAIALIQMYNRDLLIVGLGTAITCLVMYFGLENPDMNMIEELNSANKRSRDLIMNVLPLSIANKIDYNMEPVFEEFDNVSVLFMNIANFTKIASEIGEIKLAKHLHAFFEDLDAVSSHYRIAKIKSVSDSYVVVSGVPDKYENTCEETIKFGLEILRDLKTFNEKNKTDLKVKIGIHSGRAVATEFGKKKFVYNLWGDTVDLASRIVHEGKINGITVSERVKSTLGSRYDFENHGSVEFKGFGNVKTFVIK